MAAIKKFFENRKLNKKFKQAGAGHRLNEQVPSSQAQASSACRHSSSSERRPPSQAGNRAAEAALARLQQDQQQQQKKPMSKTATWKKSDEAGASTAIDYEKLKGEMLGDAHVSKGSAMQSSVSQLPCEVGDGFDPSKIHVEDTTPYICPACPMSLPKVDMLSHLEECLSKDLLSEPLMTSVAMIHSLNKNKEKVEICVQTLCKYLQNIIDSPVEEKYRKIRANNKVFQEKVGGLKGTDHFLTLACGFKIHLNKVDGQDEEKFYILENTDASQVDELSSAKSMLLEAEPLKATLDRNVKVFAQSSNAAIIAVPDSFYTLTSADIRREQESRTAAVEKELQLRTKAMREAEKDKKKRGYRYCIIRVKLPDGVLVQSTFLGRETLHDVCAFLRELLQMEWLPFSLTSPVGSKYDDLAASLSSLGLAPAALLICHVDSDIIAELAASASADGNPITFLKDEVNALIQPLE